MAICTQALERGDPMAAVLDMPRSKAVIAFWEKDVRQIFTSYAAADMDIDAQAAQDTVNLTELMYMLTEGKLLDGVNLSISKVSQIFAHVNTSADEEEEGDEDEAALYSLYCANITLLTLLYQYLLTYSTLSTLLTYSTCYTDDS